MCGNFAAVASDPSFLAQEAEAVASLLDRDEVDAAEETVFSAAVRWVQEDEGSRAGALDRLLEVVRFPMMETVDAAMAEPLFAEHRLAGKLMYECHPKFKPPAAGGCRRLRPRKGRRQPGVMPEWMETTDTFGGLKKLHHFPNVALAVSKADAMEVDKVYDAPVRRPTISL